MYRVPDTNTFSFSDITTPVFNHNRIFNNYIEGLQQAFDRSRDVLFDPNYKGDKNSLYNFRNYGLHSCSINTNTHPYWAYGDTVRPIDTFGLSLLAGGRFNPINNTYSNYTIRGYYWFLGLYVNGSLTLFNNNNEIQYGSDGYHYSLRFRKICTTEELNLPDGTIINNVCTDGSNNTYDAVKIGSFLWTTSNFKSEKYLNGSFINNPSDVTYYANLSSNLSAYGGLYSSYLASRQFLLVSELIEPSVWRTPSYDDWKDLVNTICSHYSIDPSYPIIGRYVKSCRANF